MGCCAAVLMRVPPACTVLHPFLPPLPRPVAPCSTPRSSLCTHTRRTVRPARARASARARDEEGGGHTSTVHALLTTHTLASHCFDHHRFFISSTMSVQEFIQLTPWEPVNMDLARGYNCLTKNADGVTVPAFGYEDCDIQAKAHPELCVDVGGQCAMSLADAEIKCGAIEDCAGLFCAPYYPDAERCIARSASELAFTYIYTGPLSADVYNMLKPVRIKTSTASLPPLPPLTHTPLPRPSHIRS